ncbi:homoserine O-succinyltransferase [Helicobacter sp. MIT 14-3879]|uniref:homoserine O-succinyltransferase n=1 Tax=Helicobacter sp. MIT 14-3879 TaxID=2040649 RepID=UPI000E1F4924|nr:homoserine O-succinyltransferase [Helicobacter sp. MIT 14-3879]RDU64756.1 homoserine O-succinyltransferase [Helicobacter sp. MIT 14-3879]
MPLIIPKDIPAYKLLKQNTFIMEKNRAKHQDIRALEILIINLMPKKIQTENQILSLLANSPLQVNITLLSTSSYVGKNTPKSHLDRFYRSFDYIKNRNFDGAIITGAPIEHLEFEEVTYWRELVEIMDYLKKHCTSSLYICWGAMAGLFYFHNIKKIIFKEKLFGVFEHNIINNDLLLCGLDDVVKIPHSRHSGIDESNLSNLKVLLSGDESGASVLRDTKDVFILGHPEYDKFTLYDEYKRDLLEFDIKPPKNYFNSLDEPTFLWRSSASVIFSNWLNFYVYQDTPFILN